MKWCNQSSTWTFLFILISAFVSFKCQISSGTLKWINYSSKLKKLLHNFNIYRNIRPPIWSKTKRCHVVSFATKHHHPESLPTYGKSLSWRFSWQSLFYFRRQRFNLVRMQNSDKSNISSFERVNAWWSPLTNKLFR